MVGVLDALGERSCVIVGHDWGAPVAWSAAQMRPDRFRAVVGLSVPFRPRGAVRPTTVMPKTADATFCDPRFAASCTLDRESPHAQPHRWVPGMSASCRAPENF